MADTMTLSAAEKLFDLPDPYDYADVKSAYRRLILEKHPDVRKDVDAETANREASEINTANKILSKRCKDAPTTKFSRQSEYYPTNDPWAYTGTTTSTVETDYDTPEVEVYEWEIPIENVTWEDLFNDVWSAFNESRVAAREAEGRGYSFDDWTKDAAAGAFAWAARKVARKIDSKNASATAGDNNISYNTSGSREGVNIPDYMQKQASPENMQATEEHSSSWEKIDYEDYAKYERALRWIKRLTGRFAMLLVFFFAAWTTIVVAGSMDTLGAFMYFMFALFLAAVGFLNLIFGFITNLIRKPLIEWLDDRHDHRYS